MFRNIFGKSRFVVSLGGSLTDILSQYVKPENLTVLPNATNIGDAPVREFPDSEEAVRFMFVARFARNKGIHNLVEVIKQLNEEGYKDKMHFDLAGKGPLYEHYINDFQFPNIKYWGFIEDADLIQLYKESSCFVLPTLFEGMPTVVLEAMGHGLPIIVSDVGATAELVDQSNGYLIEKNEVDRLKKAILDFYILSKEEKKTFSKNSYQRVHDNFTWQKVADRHMEVFSRIEGGS